MQKKKNQRRKMWDRVRRDYSESRRRFMCDVTYLIDVKEFFNQLPR
jgi:hypothetical protein